MRYFRTGYLLLLLLFLLAAPLGARELHLLTTGDMHGYLLAQQADGQVLGGAAEMFAYWKRVEGYTPKRFLVLSAGDNVTGPALATALKGDPVIEVMNLMHYDACALGNHEFDFSVATLRRWEQTAHFPILAANITSKDGKAADIAAPFTLLTENGIKIGIVGLVTKDLFTTTNMASDYTLIPYADALRRAVPAARQQGAQVVIVLAHVPQDELVALAGTVKELHIPLMIGGHSHEFAQRMVKDTTTWVVNSGQWWDGYSRIDLDYNEKTGNTVVLTAKQVWLQQAPARPDRRIQRAVARWQQRLGAEYGQQIGYTVAGLARDPVMYNLFSDAGLAADPSADIVLTNDGCLRQDIPSGPITTGLLVAVMPFDDSLLRLQLTGAQLLAYLPGDQPIGMAGLRRTHGQYVLLKTGQPLVPTAHYTVLLNNYMYDISPALKADDPHPITLCALMRQPVIDWLRAHPSSKEQPLESLLDPRSRLE